MPLSDFAHSDPYTLGIELELQIISPPANDLSQDSSLLVDALKGVVTEGEVKHDITESMLEIATGVCTDIAQASSQLAGLRQHVLQAASQHHLAICGGGTHPFQKWQRQEVCQSERYNQTLELFGYLMKQATVFGQHVHVGCENEEDAIYLMHGLSRFVPHVIALAASSPYIQGSDTTYASSRLNIFSAFPDNGPAPFVSNWQEFKWMYQRLESSSIVQSMKDLHWDIRPSPHFGTVEVRVMDTPLTITRAINIAGFIQALAHWLLSERPFVPRSEDYLLYRFNRFQACRFGFEGMLTDVRNGEQRTLAEDILPLLDTLAPYAAPLQATSALEAIEGYVRHNDSDTRRIRRFITEGGLLTELVREHCDIWEKE
ncbi:YbdK family carboxylate-amine ligase [Buttiauxella sp. WJP83]|uniref:YbdK family carboxylate-amine ligase n=1 Tax=Buttiauxella sp. WJP83 TaxID=2986951 RepID=UPI0022DDB1A0|nr:YbdK family carboxylate-amine ligase [Buttiauxella sp. WJP83]WBM69709.1 YbdK family carboxylate-amine ligase [Buttiauxella sp. WJP83]